uniref:C-type lectin domain-containing protein n=1 Tax=Felis catus TaxID=9685 RepID=A0ABI7YEU8_FELCA
MAIGYLSPDTVSLRVIQAHQRVPSGVRAEARGPQSQHIIVAVILTKLFSGCEIPALEMSEERVIYTELKSAHSRQQDKRRPMVKRRGFPWHIVAVTLGFLCLFFLLAITGLGYMFFHRCSGEIRQDMKAPEDKNASLAEVEDHLILLPTTAWNEDDDTFQGKWYCCGGSCYHFSKEEKTWERSVVSCRDLQSSLLKIDTKEEQVLIQSKIKYNHWIGLIRVREGRNPWQWLDGSPLSQKLNFQQSLSPVKCGHMRPSTIYTADCSNHFRYICEKEFSGPDN